MSSKNIVFQICAIALATGLLGACASPSAEFFLGGDAKPFSRQIKDCLDNWERREEAEGVEEALAEKKDKKSALNEFLDCVTGDIKIDQKNKEFRLLRGHLIVGILAIYGADSAKRSPRDSNKHAINILRHIEKVENQLWTASVCSDPSSGANCAMASPDLEKEIRGSLNRAPRLLRRILAVFELARAASEPAKERIIAFGTSFFARMSALVAAPTSPGAIGALKDAREAIARVFTLRLYSAAYASSVKEFLALIKDKRNGKPSRNDWIYVYEEYVKPACETLATLGGQEATKYNCKPSGL